MEQIKTGFEVTQGLLDKEDKRVKIQAHPCDVCDCGEDAYTIYHILNYFKTGVTINMCKRCYSNFIKDKRFLGE